jgi:hypothetical protein
MGGQRVWKFRPGSIRKDPHGRLRTPATSYERTADAGRQLGKNG